MTPDEVSYCIGCGCDDNHACRPFGCAWIHVELSSHRGVCSSTKCKDSIARWRDGDRSFSDRAMVNMHQRRIMLCKSCAKYIIWFYTASGKRMPVDAETVKPQDQTLNLLPHGPHRSHFATCPNASAHRKRA